MSKFVTCGTLKMSAGYSDIVCDITTGDLIFKDDIMGNCLMSNMSVIDPIDMSGTERENNLIKLCQAMNCQGVIMSQSYFITLNDEKAEYRKATSATTVEHVVDFDLDIEYEF